MKIVHSETYVGIKRKTTVNNSKGKLKGVNSRLHPAASSDQITQMFEFPMLLTAAAVSYKHAKATVLNKS